MEVWIVTYIHIYGNPDAGEDHPVTYIGGAFSTKALAQAWIDQNDVPACGCMISKTIIDCATVSTRV